MAEPTPRSGGDGAEWVGVQGAGTALCHVFAIAKYNVLDFAINGKCRRRV